VGSVDSILPGLKEQAATVDLFMDHMSSSAVCQSISIWRSLHAGPERFASGGGLLIYFVLSSLLSLKSVSGMLLLLRCSADDMLCRDLHLQPLLACFNNPLLPLLFAV
jgi:hypothetical protein